MSDPKDPLSFLSIAQVQDNFTVNASNALVTVQQAVLGFKQLPSSTSKTFIYTGNVLNAMTLENVILFGMAKNAVAYLMHSASKAYYDVGFK